MNNLVFAATILHTIDDCEVFIPIHNDRRIIVVDGDGLQIYLVCSVTPYKNSSSVLRTGEISSEISHVLGVDMNSRELWKIPAYDIQDTKAIRLGDRWESYKYKLTCSKFNKIIEQDDTALSKSASKIAKKLKGILNGKANKE